MFVELTRGRSFKGLAQYCLHDVDSPTSERVEFVQTRNLGTDNPQVAWRIMAARHYLQEELKEKAGVGRGGRKDGKPVGHLLISWKREEAEAEGLDRQRMLSAVAGALRAIQATQHQVMIIGHTDTQHPHCHVIINLIGEDGRLKKNWKEKEKLSKFALEREIAIHGEPVVKRRQKNWEDRQAGETPAAVKKKSRPLYELEKAALQCDVVRAFAEHHLKELTELERAKAKQKERQRRNQERLTWCRDERARRLTAATEAEIRASKTAIRKAYRPSWENLLQRQRQERAEFEQNEKTLQGSIANALSLFVWPKVFGRKNNSTRFKLADVFQIFTTESARRDHLRERQQAERDRLRSQQRQEEQRAAQKLRAKRSQAIQENRCRYVTKMAAMQIRHQEQAGILAQVQRRLTKERDTMLQSFRDQEKAAKRERLQEQSAKANRRTRRPRKARAPRKPRQQKTSPDIEVPTEDDFDQRMLDQMNSHPDRDRLDNRDY